MFELGYFLHYVSIALVSGLTSIGVGIGGGKASRAAIEALNIQPHAESEINKVFIIGMALVETAGILGIVMALLLLQGSDFSGLLLFQGIGKMGIAISLGITGMVIGIVSSYPAQEACYSVARQPFFSQKVLNLMLLTQSIIQTPLIFSFIISLIIKFQLNAIDSLADGIRLLASGFCIGIGSIGPGIGLARFARMAVRGIGINRKSYTRILPFTFISQAIIETPLIFAAIISFLLLTRNIPDTFIALASSFAAALCMGLGTFGPGVSSSRAATAACEQIAFHPEQTPILSRVSMIGQTLIDAAAIYALLIALLIIFLQ